MIGLLHLSSYQCICTKHACQHCICTRSALALHSHLSYLRLWCQAASCCQSPAGIRLSLLPFRAAFDKGDLLYLRDEEEKRRFTEMELRDSEQQQFRKERARIEANRAAALLRAAEARKDKQGRCKRHHIATLHFV